MFNPNYFNEQMYAQMQAQQYEQTQQKEVCNALKSYKDFLSAMSKLDKNHIQDVFRGCLYEISIYM